VNKSVALLLLMTFSFLFGDDNVVVRHGDQQVAQNERGKRMAIGCGGFLLLIMMTAGM